MSFSIVELGPNSASISVTSESQDTIRATLINWYSQHGWQLYDSYNDGSSNRCFILRNLCAGGITYKYAQFVISASIRMEVYENWNPVTRTGTNRGQVVYDHSCPVSSVRLYVFASQKHLGLMSQVSTTYSDPSFIFEAKRENPSDINEAGGYPAFFITSVSRLINNGGAPCPQSFPRTIAGVGASAGAASAIRSKFLFESGRSDVWTTKYYPVRSDTMLDVAETPSVFPFWNTTGMVHPTQYMGRVYAVKIIPRNFGNMLDTVNIKCDADGLTDPNGSDVQHFILTNDFSRIAVPA